MGGEYDQQIREVAMYSLPKEFDEKRFIGCTLYEIGFNANQIRLSFEPNLVVVLEGEVELWLSEHEQLMISPQEPKLELLRLIESTVESVALDASRAKFELCFNGDYRLTLLVDSDYESYRIDDGQTEGNYPPK